MRKDPKNNTWKAIPGFGGAYEIDYYGNIRRTCGKGKRTITPTLNKHGYKKVQLTGPDGKRREYRVHKLMALTYMTARPGMSLKFKNGIKTDTCLGNLEWITKTDLGKKTGANSRRQPVIKIDQSGEVVGFYPSARDAA